MVHEPSACHLEMAENNHTIVGNTFIASHMHDHHWTLYILGRYMHYIICSNDHVTCMQVNDYILVIFPSQFQGVAHYNMYRRKTNMEFQNWFFLFLIP